MIANKVRFDGPESVEIARQAKEVWAAKGKKITKIKLSDEPTDDELTAVLLGPSGKLRAPAIRVGTRLLIGFNADMYDEVF